MELSSPCPARFCHWKFDLIALIFFLVHMVVVATGAGQYHSVSEVDVYNKSACYRIVRVGLYPDKRINGSYRNTCSLQ